MRRGSLLFCFVLGGLSAPCVVRVKTRCRTMVTEPTGKRVSKLAGHFFPAIGRRNTTLIKREIDCCKGLLGARNGKINHLKNTEWEEHQLPTICQRLYTDQDVCNLLLIPSRVLVVSHFINMIYFHFNYWFPFFFSNLSYIYLAFFCFCMCTFLPHWCPQLISRLRLTVSSASSPLMPNFIPA